MKVDLKDFMREGTKVLSGRDHGAEVRCKLKLNRTDISDEIVHISIPDHVYSVNSSFFLSCFGASVRTLGESTFRKRYIFECDSVLLKNIDDGISRSLKTSSIFRCHHCNNTQHKC